MKEVGELALGAQEDVRQDLRAMFRGASLLLFCVLTQEESI